MPEFFSVGEVGYIELYLPVEPRNLFVEILAVCPAKCFEGAERVGMKQRQPIQHMRLDMVHPFELLALEPITLHACHV